MRMNGRVFEAVAARLERRPPCDLYHSALEVRVPEGRFVIEQAPVRDGNGGERGVVAEGAVGSHWAGRFRIFRYEVRRWCGGNIPDVDEAVESPRRLTDDPEVAQRVLDLTPHVPTAVWGRDEFAAGEMWNSNSIIAWLLAACGLPAGSIHPPAGGRAPGWHAGLVVARGQQTLPDSRGREPAGSVPTRRDARTQVAAPPARGLGSRKRGARPPNALIPSVIRGKNGKVRRSLGFGRVRSLERKPL